MGKAGILFDAGVADHKHGVVGQSLLVVFHLLHIMCPSAVKSPCGSRVLLSVRECV